MGGKVIFLHAGHMSGIQLAIGGYAFHKLMDRVRALGDAINGSRPGQMPRPVLFLYMTFDQFNCAAGSSAD